MSQLKYFNQSVSTPLKKKQLGPLDSAPMGIKAGAHSKILHSVHYKFQVQDHVVSKFTIFWLSKFFHFLPLLILVPIILAWCNSQHVDGQKYDISTRFMMTRHHQAALQSTMQSFIKLMKSDNYDKSHYWDYIKDMKFLLDSHVLQLQG